MLKSAYLALALLGAVLPLMQFIPWLVENGLDAPLLFTQMFANRISAFFAVDVVVSAVVLCVFIGAEGMRAGMNHLWLPIVATLCVGVSFGLPLFLYMRENSRAGL